MKVFISSDIEGTAGIVDWQQVRASGADYELGRRLLTDEVNAAIDGAARAGATQFPVNDSHSTMQNIPPNALHHSASYLSSRHKPRYMMEGLDGTFDAVFMVAYHGSVGAEHAILSHTYNPLAVWEARLNGTAVGESALNALVALHHRVPVVLITGDDATAEEAQPFLPGSRRWWSSARRSVAGDSPRSRFPRSAPTGSAPRDVGLDPRGRARRRGGNDDHGRRASASVPHLRDDHQPDPVDRRAVSGAGESPDREFVHR